MSTRNNIVFIHYYNQLNNNSKNEILIDTPNSISNKFVCIQIYKTNGRIHNQINVILNFTTRLILLVTLS